MWCVGTPVRIIDMCVVQQCIEIEEVNVSQPVGGIVNSIVIV